MADEETGEVRVRPFADILQEIDEGQFHAELSRGIRDLIAGVNETGKVGSLNITIKAGPAGRNAYGNVLISHSVSVKVPEGARPESVWFTTPDGNLTRENPAQQRLPLREVPKPTIRSINPEEAVSNE